MFAASKTSAAVAGAPPPPSGNDPQFNNVTLLLHGDGTNGAQNNTFVDSSTNNFTITRNGTPTQGSFSPYGTLWSIFSTSSSDFLSGTGNVQFTGNFTIEAWVFITSAAGRDVFKIGSEASGRVSFGVDSSNRLFSSAFGTSSILYGGASVSLNTWTHVAWVRNGTTVTGYVNGVAQGTQTISGNVGNTSGFSVGQGPMYTSNARLVNGTALYTSNFTPSTTPLTAVSGTSLLTCQSNRFRDNSSNNFAITVTGTPSVQRFSPFDPAAEYSTSVIGGSGFFGGSGQYLNIASPTTTVREWWTTDYTIEAWIYPTTTTGLSYAAGSTVPTMCGNASSTANVNYWSFGPVADRTVKFYYFNGSENYVTSSQTVTLNQWNHIAMTKTSSGIIVWVNGIGMTAIAVSGTPQAVSATPFSVGQINSTALTAYLANIRIVKGTAVYTTTFTPPTAPLTAITNTSLLLNTVNAGIFDNAMMNNLVTVGNAQVSTAVVKYGTGSMAFDGTNDYLPVASSQSANFGSGDFTVEYWTYPTSFSSGIGYIQHVGGATNTSTALSFGEQGGFPYATTSTTGQKATTSLSLNTWSYVAWTRSGTTLRCFINGTLITTFTNSVVVANPTVGVGATSSGLHKYAGYIDDLRITRVARYTANFTPPTAAFPNL